MRRSKYPSLGILDALHRLLHGTSGEYSQQGLYESLADHKPPLGQYAKIVHSLEHNGYIRRRNKKIGLTKKGREKATMRDLERISLSQTHDGFQRLIAFDIPERMRFARDIMRAKLKSFQCDTIQKSLYLTPYVCENEIYEITRILKIERYVHVLKLAKESDHN